MKRYLLRGAALVLALLVATAFWIHYKVAASLPQLDGERSLAGLSAAVRIERDAAGVPRVAGENRKDVVRALGFLHAQERFFQMDLMRRQASGELAELLGSALVETDRKARLHRMRDVARRVALRATPEEKALLDAYTEGVNAGLGALGEVPFEYLLLRVTPAPWRPEDSVLVVHSMFFSLNDETARFDATHGLLEELYPRQFVDFIAPAGGPWDAPVVGEPFTVPPIPTAGVFDLRREPEVEPPLTGLDLSGFESEAWRGSNNWVVAGTRTADGGALLADDMHLGISVPNTWYRAELLWKDENDSSVRLIGVTLPGAPTVVVGTNTHVAWGFTNSTGDWSDLVLVEPDPQDERSYLTAEGPRPFETHTETIPVRGGPPVTLSVRSTVWGPVLDNLDRDTRGRLFAVRWIAHSPEATNFKLNDLAGARTVEEAMDVANRSGIPPQNFVCADDRGSIGWTIMGKIPRRGEVSRVPASWKDKTRSWDGWLSPGDYPKIVNPPSGFIWTANARVVDGEALRIIGDGGYALGARARQIRDDLRALERATEKDLLSVQLDDRALFLEPWRHLVLKDLSPEVVAGAPDRAEFKRLVEQTWTGRASPDSVAYRLVKATRAAVFQEVYGALTERCRRVDPGFQKGLLRQWEAPLFQLVTARPLHLLPRPYDSWSDLVVAAVDRVIQDLKRTGPLASRTWGERNTALIQHPLSRGLPFLSRFLDMPRRPLAGDTDMPRVQGVGSGASERLVVSPGREEKGLFHMPGGQSGHPLSPHYRIGHDAWCDGVATPLLPGEAKTVLTLRPSPVGS